MSSFNQAVPGVPTLINSSSVLVTGNAASANALTVRQYGGGNVFSAQTTTGSTALFVSGSGNVGVGTTNPRSKFTVENGNIYMNTSERCRPTCSSQTPRTVTQRSKPASPLWRPARHRPDFFFPIVQ